MKEHKCKAPDYCICNLQSLAPKEDCPLHGYPPYRNNCMICGAFVYRRTNENSSYQRYDTFNENVPIGPNACAYCGMEYGEHSEDCLRPSNI